MNRAVFDFNQKLDHSVAIPIATFYNRAVPELVRNGVHNFLVNLDLPITFGNDVLQGKVDRAGETLGRLGVNSTVGVGGLFDVASKIGIPSHTEDFGLTLGKYGASEGAYLVLPFIGPAPPRDLFGKVADTFLDPLTYIGIRDKIYWSIGRGGLSVIDDRAQNIDTVESIERTSVDYYASVRSLYRQYRNAQIQDGKPDIKDLPDY
jgi:phospholipid-binding lipoprotein MlaA